MDGISRVGLATVSPLNPDVLFKMLEQTDQKSEEGHHRLREDLRALEARIGHIESCQSEVRTKLTKLEAPQDLTKSVIPTKLWLAMLMLAIMIVGAAYSVKSDVRDIATQQTAQTKLDDSRSDTLRDSVAELKRMQEMQRVQLESLTKTVLTQQQRR